MDPHHVVVHSAGFGPKLRVIHECGLLLAKTKRLGKNSPPLPLCPMTLWKFPKFSHIMQSLACSLLHL
jgi:hypothetical protein